MRKTFAAAVLSIGVVTAAAIAGPAAMANTGPGGGTGPHKHHPCQIKARTRTRQSLNQFDRAHGTTPLEVIARSFACYYGEPPNSFVAYVNHGRFNARLQPGIVLFWEPSIAFPH